MSRKERMATLWGENLEIMDLVICDQKEESD